MALTPTRSDPPKARVPTQPTLVLEGSPLAIIGVFIVFLQERFGKGNGPPAYLYKDNPTNTKIVIESAFDDHRAERGKKPAIYVDKDSTTYQQISLGDRADFAPKSGRDWGMCHSLVPVRIECVSNNKGESATLGDLVQASVYIASDVIQKSFALHNITAPVLSRTIPYEHDQEAWNSVVTFSVTCTIRWSTVPVAPLLQEVVMKIRAGAGEDSATSHLMNIATHSKRTAK